MELGSNPTQFHSYQWKFGLFKCQPLPISVVYLWTACGSSNFWCIPKYSVDINKLCPKFCSTHLRNSGSVLVHSCSLAVKVVHEKVHTLSVYVLALESVRPCGPHQPLAPNQDREHSDHSRKFLFAPSRRPPPSPSRGNTLSAIFSLILPVPDCHVNLKMSPAHLLRKAVFHSA